MIKNTLIVSECSHDREQHAQDLTRFSRRDCTRDEMTLSAAELRTLSKLLVAHDRVKFLPDDDVFFAGCCGEQGLRRRSVERRR